MSRDPNLLVGADHFSDAGVYRLDERTAIVQSLDFFPPLVDDPYVFGRIAAANALSDVYAMGGEPRTALNIVGFPDDELGLDVLGEILRGGSERVAAAGAVVVGGHSVRDAEIKYGLSVTGIVDPARMMRNDAARPGDALVLTKGLGTGFVTTANRAGSCPAEVLDAACASMIALNAAASRAALAVGAEAATDITGFGLAGHASEMARASDVTIVVEIGRLPVLPGVEALVAAGNRTRANATNREFALSSGRIDGDVSEDTQEVVFDPQTSGGLLVALAPDRVAEYVEACRAGGLESTVEVGVVQERGDVHLVLRA